MSAISSQWMPNYSVLALAKFSSAWCLSICSYFFRPVLYCFVLFCFRLSVLCLCIANTVMSMFMLCFFNTNSRCLAFAIGLPLLCFALIRLTYCWHFNRMPCHSYDFIYNKFYDRRTQMWCTQSLDCTCFFYDDELTLTHCLSLSLSFHASHLVSL